MSKVNFNNIYLNLANGDKLSIAQHYDENGELLCNEIAVVTKNVLSDPIPFEPSLADFLDTLTDAMTRAA